MTLLGRGGHDQRKLRSVAIFKAWATSDFDLNTFSAVGRPLTICFVCRLPSVRLECLLRVSFTGGRSRSRAWPARCLEPGVIRFFGRKLFERPLFQILGCERAFESDVQHVVKIRALRAQPAKLSNDLAPDFGPGTSARRPREQTRPPTQDRGRRDGHEGRAGAGIGCARARAVVGG